MRRTAASALLILSFALACAAESLNLTILYTNDLHGYMLPFDYRNDNASFARREMMADIRYQHSDLGGLARRASLIGEVRRTASAPVLLIDSGDLFTRGPWGGSLLGEPEIEIYNLLGYDAVCVGNNEFKALPGVEAQEVLLDRMRESEFPWVCANLTVGATGVPVEGVRPFVVRRAGNIRIAFLGLTSDRSREYPQTKDWTIDDPFAAAAKWVPIARGQCDLLIAVTHIGWASDRELAGKVEGIDAILGGDSHTFLPSIEEARSPSGAEVPITQDGAYGVALGRLDLIVEKDASGSWRIKEAEARLIAVDSAVPEDPGVAKILERWIPVDDPERARLRKQPAAAR